MVNYILILLLYSPVLFLCLLYPLKDRYKIRNDSSEAQFFSLISAIVFLTLLLSHYVIQSFWFKSPMLSYSYSQFGWELFVFIWNLIVLVLIIILSKIAKISFHSIFNVRKYHVYNMLKVGFIFTCAIVLLSQLFGAEITHEMLKDNLMAVKSMSLSLLILFLINTIVLIPFVEEIVFRGFLYLPLYRKVGQNAAILLTSYIFLHAHFAVLLQSIFGSLVILIKGLFLTWLYAKKKTLIYPIGFHILFNAWFVYLQLFLIQSK